MMRYKLIRFNMTIFLLKRFSNQNPVTRENDKKRKRKAKQKKRGKHKKRKMSFYLGTPAF